jgi:hypothetical protein
VSPRLAIGFATAGSGCGAAAGGLGETGRGSEIKRPDLTFMVNVCTVEDIYPCEARKADEARGFFGFHNSDKCPDCKIIPRGWEMWGENGHLQGQAHDREHMVYWIGYKAKQQWPTQAVRNGIMGYRFRKGGTLRYLGQA